MRRNENFKDIKRANPINSMRELVNELPNGAERLIIAIKGDIATIKLNRTNEEVDVPLSLLRKLRKL